MEELEGDVSKILEGFTRKTVQNFGHIFPPGPWTGEELEGHVSNLLKGVQNFIKFS